ncbi:MAG: hypothetical protein P1U34_05645 [Coxiellaceae bacterium]|nr:hypothetical protein [Coxiellaceae bacterium]
MSRSRRQQIDSAPVQQVMQRLKTRPELANMIIKKFVSQYKGYKQHLSLLHAFFKADMLPQYKAQVLMMMHRRFSNIAVLHALLDPNRQRPQRDEIVLAILESGDKQEFLMAIDVKRTENCPVKYKNTSPYQLTNSAIIISEIYRANHAASSESKQGGEGVSVSRLTALVDSLQAKLIEKDDLILVLKKQIGEHEILNANLSCAYDALSTEYDTYKEDAEQKLSTIEREHNSAKSSIGTPLACQEELPSLSGNSGIQNSYRLFQAGGEVESGSGWQIVAPVPLRPKELERHVCLSPQQLETGSSPMSHK